MKASLLTLAGSVVLGAHAAEPAWINLDGKHRYTDAELRNLVALPGTGFLAEVEGGRLYSGRKTLFMDPAFEAVNGNNNFRRLLDRVTGVHLIEEETQGSHFNLGFRGITPNNGAFTQVYQDGFPLNVNAVGTRFVVAVPDVNQITQMQVSYGNTGVSAGSHFGGAVNLISYPLPGDQLARARSTTAGGDHGHFSQLLEAGGTDGEWSYGLFGRFARGDTFRAQPEFDNYSAGLKLERRFSDVASLSAAYTFYEFDAEQLNGSALVVGGVNSRLNYYYQNATSHHLNFLLEAQLPNGARMENRLWYHHTEGVRDFSATAGGFLGVILERNNYAGLDSRVIREYDLGPLAGNVLTAGAVVQGSDSPFHGPTINLEQHDFNWGLFAENQFRITPRLSLTPGVRYDHSELGGSGVRTGAAVNRKFSDGELLFSVTGEYDLFEPGRLGRRPAVIYAGWSKQYRAPTFNETVLQGGANTLAPNLESAVAYQAEAGLRGTPRPWLLYDVSGFWMDVDDQFGNIGTVVSNAGRTRHYGVEWLHEIELLGLADSLAGLADPDEPRLGPRSPATERGNARRGRLSLFTGLSWLKTEILSSPAAAAIGQDVPYAPEWTAKVGLTWNWFERFKATAAWRHVHRHLGNAGNDDQLTGLNTGAFIPSYQVLDLAVEYTFARDRASVFLNLNNVLNEGYFASFQGGVTAASQIPAPGRNLYAGLRLSF